MRPPEHYARARRRWGLATLLLYAALLAALGLPRSFPAAFGGLFLLAIGLGIACLVASGLFLFSWTQRDVADGRFEARPARSAALRFLPGLVILGTAALPLSDLRAVLFVSGLYYLPLALLAELTASAYGRLQGRFPPPTPAVNLTASVGTLAAIAAFVFLAVLPPIEFPLPHFALASLLTGLAAFSVVLGRAGARGDVGRKSLWRTLLPDGLRPRETFALYVTAGLDLVVVAFILSIVLLHIR